MVGVMKTDSNISSRILDCTPKISNISVNNSSYNFNGHHDSDFRKRGFLKNKF